MSIKKLISKKLPFLGKYKRFGQAFLHCLITQKSYSQHGEDLFFVEFIKKNNIDIAQYMYIDVGANHPTDISNTYALYKSGMSGIIIEPNTELIKLFKIFRKRDKRLAIGVSNENTVMEFYISKTPVISSFNQEWMSSEIAKSILVPVLTLDNALKKIISKKIFLTSIDVEGLNKEVVEGGLETIKKSLLVCLEFDNEGQRTDFKEMLGSDFEELTTLHCNAIFRNKKFKY